MNHPSDDVAKSCFLFFNILTGAALPSCGNKGKRFLTVFLMFNFRYKYYRLKKYPHQKRRTIIRLLIKQLSSYKYRAFIKVSGFFNYCHKTLPFVRTHHKSLFFSEKGTKSLKSSGKWRDCCYLHIQIYIFMNNFLHEDLGKKFNGRAWSVKKKLLGHLSCA